MCRMAIVPSELKADEAVTDLLLHLEDSMGGDGNGFSFYDASSNTIKVVKGAKLKIEEGLPSIDAASNMFLFHSRKTSAGSTSDYNTQPFAINEEQTALCHNGTWSKYSDFKAALFCQGVLTADEYSDMSDTHTLAKMIDLPNVGLKALNLPESGVFILFKKDYADIYVKSGDWQAYKRKDGMYLYASEFPNDKYPNIFDFKSGSIIRAWKDKFKIIKGGVTYEKNTTYTYNVHRRDRTYTRP
jgi:predicted glutamine amidotransferase